MISFDPSLFSNLPPRDAPDIIIGTRRFHELLPGDKFKALILDIKPGAVTIRLDDGGTFTARSLVLPEARIGEQSLFVVRENDMQGHISLEMGKFTPEERQDNLLREALRSAGIHVNEETIKLGRALIKNNLPLDVNSLQKATYFYFSPPEGKMTPPDGVAFLLKENFPAEQSLVSTFNGILSEPGRLQNNISAITDWILRAEPKQADVLLKALLGEKEAPPHLIDESVPIIKNLLRKKLYVSFDPNAKEREPLKEYFRALNSRMERLIDAAEASGLRGALPEAAEKVRETLRFMAQVSANREYYQIPFVNQASEQKYQADLTVFKDKKAQSGDVNKTYSALIALDTAGLARTEAYIQKTGKHLSITFRADTARALKTLSAASGLLTQALAKKNIPVTNLIFNEISEPFTLISGKPYAEPKAEKPEENKRFTFDMRI